MDEDQFVPLMQAIYLLKGIPEEVVQGEACHLEVDGIAFTLIPGGMSGRADSALYLCDFGALPDACGPLGLRRLLETNLYLFGPSSPVFTCNPENGNVLLMGSLAIARITPQSVVDMMAQVAAYARQWAETYFLEDLELENLDVLVRAGRAAGTATTSNLSRL
jgi:hypothetical protein